MLQTISSDHYWLINAHIPICLLTEKFDVNPTWENLAAFDLEIQNGKVLQILPNNLALNHSTDTLNFNLQGWMVWPCFVDMHTHLDKGHIWHRNPNPDGTFASAILATQSDHEKYWQAEDVFRRMEFGLKCSYAHGTAAVRTHIDCLGEQAAISLDVFKALCDRWADRLTLQAASLLWLENYAGQTGEALADRIAEVGGVLGGVMWMNPDLDAQIDRLFDLAKERSLSLDLHIDENNDPNSETLRHVAEAALRHDYLNKVICGHCCSLAVQEQSEVEQTIQLVKAAGIGIVSLPMCNLYLQDRQANRTPRWRGVTLLHELREAGIPVAIASDNCRDPFYGFGDHDGLEVFNMSTRNAHLDMPYGKWPQAITTTPADLMQLPQLGRISVGLPANLIIFKARYFSELLSRPQSDRIVIRNGKSIDSTLPDYAELDDLLVQA